MQDKIDNPPTVTIRGVVSADDPPVAVYVSGENTAVQGVAEYSLRIPKYKMMRDHDIICTSGKVFTTLHLSSDSLLARDFIRVVDIVFPRNETADMPRTAAAYNELTSLPLNP
jgi:hypothetical protein